MPRDTRILRQWQIVKLLQSQRLTIQQLANIAECHPRTVARDLAVLLQVHFPIEQTDAVVYYIPRDRQREVA